MATVQTHLWFDDEAEEAMDFYMSIFEDSKLNRKLQTPDDSIAEFQFELNGMPVTALNTGSRATYNEYVSLYVATGDQAETDYYWNALIADGGSEQPCGWLKDRFGIYWQVIPEQLMAMLGDPDRARAKRVMDAMYRMKKIVIADLEAAYADAAA